MKSGAQIARERKGWARGRLLTAWLILARSVDRDDLTREQLDELETAVEEARAIATEWGIDPREVIEDGAALL